MLGPVGMFLSVPLTITAKIALAASDETRWAAVLLGTGEEATTSDRAGGGEIREASAPEEDGAEDEAKADDPPER